MTASNVKCSVVRHFVEIHELQTELSVFAARGVANFGTRCNNNIHKEKYSTVVNVQ